MFPQSLKASTYILKSDKNLVMLQTNSIKKSYMTRLP